MGLLWWLICTKGGEKREGSGSIYDVNDVRWTHGVGSSSLMHLTSSSIPEFKKTPDVQDIDNSIVDIP